MHSSWQGVRGCQCCRPRCQAGPCFCSLGIEHYLVGGDVSLDHFLCSIDVSRDHAGTCGARGLGCSACLCCQLACSILQVDCSGSTACHTMLLARLPGMERALSCCSSAISRISCHYHSTWVQGSWAYLSLALLHEIAIAEDDLLIHLQGPACAWILLMGPMFCRFKGQCHMHQCHARDNNLTKALNIPSTLCA